MPQLDFATYTGQLFWLAISFVVLYTLVSRLILPSIADVVEVRAKHIADDLDKAESLKDQAESAETKAQKILAESTGKARGLIAESAGKAKSKIEAKRAELATKLEQKIKKAESEIAKIEKESAEAVEKLSGELAQDIAGKIIKAA
mgnify:CR=1 FL=1